MKNILFTFLLLPFFATAQVAVFHPVKIPQNQEEKFLEIETNYSKKVAQNAVKKGDLLWWALMKSFNYHSLKKVTVIGGFTQKLIDFNKMSADKVGFTVPFVYHPLISGYSKNLK